MSKILATSGHLEYKFSTSGHFERWRNGQFSVSCSALALAPFPFQRIMIIAFSRQKSYRKTSDRNDKESASLE
jgi:heme/copper-type cytochrome/quinol oxidase subunit 2